MKNKIILGIQDPNIVTRLIIKHDGKYVCSIYRSDIIYSGRDIHARRYKSRTYVDHICEKLNLTPSKTEVLYIKVDTTTGEITRTLQ